MATTETHEEQIARLHKRIDDLIEACNRHEKLGRNAERFIRLAERALLAGSVSQTMGDMFLIVIQEHRKDFPRNGDSL